MGDLALFSRPTGTLVGNIARVTDPNSEEFEVSNGKNYLHPDKSPEFLPRSVNILVRMVWPESVNPRFFVAFWPCFARLFFIVCKG